MRRIPARGPTVFALATALVAVGATACVAGSAQTNHIGAYFISWGIYDRNYQVTNLPARLLTFVNYAFAAPEHDDRTDTAEVRLYDSWADVEKPYPGDDAENPAFKGNFNQLVKLKRRWPHLVTLLSVGGWTLSTNFSDIAATSHARDTTVIDPDVDVLPRRFYRLGASSAQGTP